MTWFLFMTQSAKRSKPLYRMAASHGSTISLMRASTCLRLTMDSLAAVGRVLETARGLLSVGVRVSNIHKVSIPKFSRFGLEIHPNPY